MFHLLNKAREQFRLQLPFTLYSKPGEPIVTGMFQDDSTLHPVADYTGAGFVFAPFDRQATGILLIPHLALSADLEPLPEATTTICKPAGTDVDQAARAFYMQLVQQGLTAIKEGSLRKVVLSRRLQRRTPDSPFKLFARLLAQYPGAFCYMWYHPVTGIWMGATPELLLHSDRHTLTTMSLAGTRTLKDGPGPFWGPKEKEEQELVTQHIVLQLAPYLDNMEVSIPESIEAGSLWHLRTSIRGIIRDHGLQPVINALHPTPAVCGLPVDKAREFILKSEKYDREFYTGFLGELNWGTGKHTSLYVNLRCMKLYKDQATIFVGGGITSSSEPGPEWDETVAKSTTMLKVLGY